MIKLGRNTFEINKSFNGGFNVISFKIYIFLSIESGEFFRNMDLKVAENKY